MFKFLTPLDTRAYKPDEFVLMHDFEIDLSIDGYGGYFRLVVPRGFITDFASTPKTMQAIPGFDVNGQSRDAAIPHDYLYCCGGVIDPIYRGLSPAMNVGGFTVLRLTRKHCDRVLYCGLIASGYSKALAWLFYVGVRIGGHWHWRKEGLRPDYDFAPLEFMADPVIAELAEECGECI